MEYLQGGIDREVLNAFFNAGLIYESADCHNAVFVGKNQEGAAKGVRYALEQGKEVVNLADLSFL